MKTLVLAVAIATLTGQSAGGSIAGSWTAQFDGRTFVRLELKTVNGAMEGALSIGHFEVDAQGRVTRADAAAQTLTPIFDVTLSGSTVTFSRKDVDDTDKFLLRVLDTGGADLQLLFNDADREELAADGIPLPKPIHLTKAG